MAAIMTRDLGLRQLQPAHRQLGPMQPHPPQDIAPATTARPRALPPKQPTSPLSPDCRRWAPQQLELDRTISHHQGQDTHFRCLQSALQQLRPAHHRSIPTARDRSTNQRGAIQLRGCGSGQQPCSAVPPPEWGSPPDRHRSHGSPGQRVHRVIGEAATYPLL